MLYKAYYYSLTSRLMPSVAKTLLVPADDIGHALLIVKAYDESAYQIRLESMP